MPDTPVSIPESSHTFSFGNISWAAVVKYDDSLTHQAIAKHVQQLQAVDFVVLGRTSCPRVALIEVKDFSVAQRQPRVKELAMEVAEKVAGTLTGLSSAARAPGTDFRWKDAGKALLAGSTPVVVYLYVEYPDGENLAQVRGALESLRGELASKLSWLPGCEVIACNQRVPRIPDCAVQRG